MVTDFLHSKSPGALKNLYRLWMKQHQNLQPFGLRLRYDALVLPVEKDYLVESYLLEIAANEPIDEAQLDFEIFSFASAEKLSQIYNLWVESRRDIDIITSEPFHVMCWDGKTESLDFRFGKFVVFKNKSSIEDQAEKDVVFTSLDPALEDTRQASQRMILK